MCFAYTSFLIKGVKVQQLHASAPCHGTCDVMAVKLSAEMSSMLLTFEIWLVLHGGYRLTSKKPCGTPAMLGVWLGSGSAGALPALAPPLSKELLGKALD